MQVNIPGYQIKHVLGKGGMATVYLAVQEIFEREVALKVMSASLAEDPSFGQRFMREARIVSQLVHPNIVTVFDVGVHEQWYYLSMEYIAGPDLKQACRSLALPQKLSILEDVAQALAFAGDKGFVHRDIKPENILLREAKTRAVLMDFGIARAAETDLSVTQTGTSLGTPHYMSPEQAKGLTVDHRSDLYSLGVVFYFLLMEEVPYQADSAVAIGIKHITDPVPELPQYLQLLNPFIERLLAKQPEQRYQTAAELIADLQRIDLKKLLKQYAGKAKFEAQRALFAEAQPTAMHGDVTRMEAHIEDALLQARPAPAVRTKLQRLYRSPGFAVALFALLVLAIGLLWRQHEPTKKPTQVTAIDESEQRPSMSTAVSEPSTDESPQPSGNVFDRLGSGFTQFAQKLTRQQQRLSQQVQQLRQQMRDNAQDAPSIRKKLDRLEQKQFAELDKLFDQGEVEQAQTESAVFAQLFADYPAKLDQVQQRLQASQSLKELSRKARQRMEQGQYLKPEEDSAEHYYMAMLVIAPQMQEAHQGLVRMARASIAQANQAFLAGDWQAAQEVVDQLLALDPNHRDSQELKQKIQAYRQNEGAIEQHLERAQGHMLAGNLYSPADNNAFSEYQKVLELQPQQRAALQGQDRVLQALEERVFSMLERGERGLAQETLDVARSARGDDRRLQQLQNDLNQYSSPEKSRRTPEVKRLLVAAQPMDDLTHQQSSKLEVQHTLFVGMEFQSFDRAGAKVHAVLYGPEGLAQANVPVTLISTQGTQFFKIDRPRKAFEKGRYQLKLLYAGETLQHTEFSLK